MHYEAANIVGYHATIRVYPGGAMTVHYATADDFCPATMRADSVA